MSGEKVRIRSLSDISRVLLYEDARVCLGLLQAIERSPEQLLAFPKVAGEDIIDMLLHHAEDSVWPEELRRAFRRALAAFDDSRVTGFFLMLFTTSGDPEVLAAAAGRLAQEPPDDLHPVLAGHLYADGAPVHTRMVARLLAGSRLLKPAERVRVEVLADVPVGEEQGLSEEDVPHWLSELGRAYAADARACLVRRGADAFAVLRRSWASLSTENQAWMLGWGAEADPLHTVPLLSEALESDCATLVVAALGVLPRLGPPAALFEPTLRRLRESANGEIRAAARAAAETPGAGIGGC